MSNPSELLELLAERVRKLMEGNPACHDYDHTRRVCLNARLIARGEGADAEVVEAAALLHDIARDQELEEGKVHCHALLGAQAAAEILREMGVRDEQFIARVCECVAAHRYRRRQGQEPPATLEARVIFDADKLDSLGAVGIGRAFHFAGRTGARLHNSPESALSSQAYTREDTAYREYLVKLRHLSANLLTETGRSLAQTRQEFMAEFFRRLCTETGTRFPEEENF